MPNCDLCDSYISPYNSITLATPDDMNMELCLGWFTELYPGGNLVRTWHNCVSTYAGLQQSKPSMIQISNYDDQHAFDSWEALNKWANHVSRDRVELEEAIQGLDHPI